MRLRGRDWFDAFGFGVRALTQTLSAASHYGKLQQGKSKNRSGMVRRYLWFFLAFPRKIYSPV